MLDTPRYVSTIVGVSVDVDQVYQTCTIMFLRYQTRADLLILYMVDFDIIFGISWLIPYHVIFYCYTKENTVSMLGLDRLE